jgi:hypothetical protein
MNPDPQEHTTFWEGLEQTLACTGDIVFCGQANTSQEALKRSLTREEEGEIPRRLDSLEEDIKKFGKNDRPRIVVHGLGKSRLTQSLERR